MIPEVETPFSEMSFDEMVAEGHAIVGSPDTVTNRLGELQAELGFGQLIGLFSVGDMPHERAVANMERFAADVMPKLRPLGAATSPA